MTALAWKAGKTKEQEQKELRLEQGEKTKLQQKREGDVQRAWKWKKKRRKVQRGYWNVQHCESQILWWQTSTKWKQGEKKQEDQVESKD